MLQSRTIIMKADNIIASQLCAHVYITYFFTWNGHGSCASNSYAPISKVPFPITRYVKLHTLGKIAQSTDLHKETWLSPVAYYCGGFPTWLTLALSNANKSYGLVQKLNSVPNRVHSNVKSLQIPRSPVRFLSTPSYTLLWEVLLSPPPTHYPSWSDPFQGITVGGSPCDQLCPRQWGSGVP